MSIIPSENLLVNWRFSQNFVHTFVSHQKCPSDLCLSSFYVDHPIYFVHTLVRHNFKVSVQFIDSFVARKPKGPAWAA